MICKFDPENDTVASSPTVRMIQFMVLSHSCASAVLVCWPQQARIPFCTYCSRETETCWTKSPCSLQGSDMHDLKTCDWRNRNTANGLLQNIHWQEGKKCCAKDLSALMANTWFRRYSWFTRPASIDTEHKTLYAAWWFMLIVQLLVGVGRRVIQSKGLIGGNSIVVKVHVGCAFCIFVLVLASLSDLSRAAVQSRAFAWCGWGMAPC